MPIYEYRCTQCGERFEQFIRSAAAQQKATCPRCGSQEVVKAISLFVAGGTPSPAEHVCATEPT